MNWEEIKKKCPKAFVVFVEWTRKMNLYHTNPLIMYFNPKEQICAYRILYDFFDEKNIIIGIDTVTSNGHSTIFDWTIREHDFDNDLGYAENDIYSRTEAETEAFTKAFEILEKRLK